MLLSALGAGCVVEVLHPVAAGFGNGFRQVKVVVGNIQYFLVQVFGKVAVGIVGVFRYAGIFAAVVPKNVIYVPRYSVINRYKLVPVIRVCQQINSSSDIVRRLQPSAYNTLYVTVTIVRFAIINVYNCFAVFGGSTQGIT